MNTPPAPQTPAVVVTFPLEGAPIVSAAWRTDEDDWRMTAWLDAHPQYAALIHEAVELAEGKDAA